LVAERAGDPRYVQQETFPGGRTIRWDPDTPLGAKFRDTFEGRITAFRAKFGRDPGPDDPLFFDPNADEPAPLSEDTLNTAIDGMIANADQAGLDPAYLKAWRELGYLITDENQHLFSAAEVLAFLDTWERYQDDGDDVDLDISDIVDLLADQLETAVQETLTQQSAEPARLLAAIVGEADAAVLALEDYDVEAEGAPAVSIAFAIVAAWAAGAREDLNTPDLADTVLDWIATHLGEPIAALTRRAAGILGSAGAPDITINQLAGELGPDFIPAMVWLATGLVAEHGSGDTAWLRRYDLHSDNT
jgi:hypothetical protein